MLSATKKINLAAGSGLVPTNSSSALNRTTSSQMKQLTQVQKANFSYYHNFHHPILFFVNGRKHTTDYNIDLYSSWIRSFLSKRWTAKREIPAKISIMKDMGASYKQAYF